MILFQFMLQQLLKENVFQDSPSQCFSFFAVAAPKVIACLGLFASNFALRLGPRGVLPWSALASLAALLASRC